VQAKSTGHLNIIGYALNAMGGLARVFTSLQEGSGIAMARAYALGEALVIFNSCNRVEHC
jgi:hypothetical protein